MKHISAVMGSTIEVKEKWAILPVITDSGKNVWGRKYIKVQKMYSGLAGELPSPMWTEIYTPNEWLLEQIKNPKKDPITSSGKSRMY